MGPPEEFIECLTTHLQDKLMGHRPLVNQMLKVFDEDITPQQVNALSGRVFLISR